MGTSFDLVRIKYKFHIKKKIVLYETKFKQQSRINHRKKTK